MNETPNNKSQNADEGAEIRHKIESEPIPELHRDLMDTRRMRVANGEVTLLDWDQVKHLIGKK